LARSSRRKRGISLPWEERPTRLRGLLSGARFQAILALLVVVGLSALLWKAADQRSRVRETRMAIAEVRTAVLAFREAEGRCPDRLSELVRPPRAGRRYLREVPRDGWGRRLYVRCPSRHDPDQVDIVSAGPDGSFFEDDNVQ
jgi:hypothetical protein